MHLPVKMMELFGSCPYCPVIDLSQEKRCCDGAGRVPGGEPDPEAPEVHQERSGARYPERLAECQAALCQDLPPRVRSRAEGADRDKGAPSSLYALYTCDVLHEVVMLFKQTYGRDSSIGKVSCLPAWPGLKEYHPLIIFKSILLILPHPRLASACHDGGCTAHPLLCKYEGFAQICEFPVRGLMLIVALHMQVAQKQEAEELKESGLEGKDAFGELVKLSSNGNSSGTNGNGATHRNDAREDLERLYRDAAEGIVVAGREATWEATRPMVLPAGESQKLRGFIDYRRRTSSSFVMQQHIQGCICLCALHLG